MPSVRSFRARRTGWLGLLPAMALFVGPHEVGARTSAVGTVDTGGQATSPAMRLGRPGELAFPVQPTPRCDILDNFGDPRSGGRRHQGIDILATLGQEVYAVADGVLTVQYVDGSSGTSLSGNGWVLTEPEGTYTFYAHLSAFAAGLREGSPVTRGQVIGYVGDTGNPGPGNYHLHFEVHPGGGAAVDPLDVLTIPTQCRIY